TQPPSLSRLTRPSPLPPVPLASTFFFTSPTSAPAIYTLSLHDALPIWRRCAVWGSARRPLALHLVSGRWLPGPRRNEFGVRAMRSEEHTSELQSLAYLVCRLLLEKKNKPKTRRLTRPSINDCHS